MGGTRPTPAPWLRAWHLLQAVAFLGLLVSGLSMHYADSGWAPLPFRAAVRTHNVLGVATVVLWLAFAVANRRSRNDRHYFARSERRGGRLRRQLRYYAWGLFRGETNPAPSSEARKFNPAQQLAYALTMYGLMPVAGLSGSFLLFPLLAPEHALGLPGMLPMAMIHLAVGYLLSLFLVAHVYLSLSSRG